MEITGFIPYIVIGIITFYFQHQYKGKKEQVWIITIGIAIALWYSAEYFIFTQHNWLSIGVIVFAPIWAIITWYLLKKNDVYLLESTIDNEILYDMGLMSKKYCNTRRQRILIMDEDVYREKKHIGEQDNRFWQLGDKLKLCDYYDDATGTIYHPQFMGELHNINFYVAKSFWLKLKEIVPEIIKTNQLLTWLEPFRVAYAQKGLAKQFELRLMHIEKQYENDMFTLPDDINKIFEREKTQAEIDDLIKQLTEKQATQDTNAGEDADANG